MPAFDDLVKRTVDEGDMPRRNHFGRVTVYTIAIARAMGLTKEETGIIARGAYLHDIGKMALPPAILIKPGPLTSEETATMREHCLLGYQMVRKSQNAAGVDEIIYSHHENYDGTGYPRRTQGQQIPLGARIVAVANTLDSITADLPYRAARPLSAAKEEIRLWSGRQFDPQIVGVFLAMPDKIWPDLVQSLPASKSPGPRVQ